MIFKNIWTIVSILSVSWGIFAEEWAEKEGVIREIDAVNRTAVISGYRYYFGTSSGYQASNIELLVYSRGAFELLEVGMKVQFHYTSDEPWYRILWLRQLPKDAWLDNNELHDAFPEGRI